MSINVYGIDHANGYNDEMISDTIENALQYIKNKYNDIEEVSILKNGYLHNITFLLEDF